MLLHLLLSALSPMLDSMHTWLYHSAAGEWGSDFFVGAGVKVRAVRLPSGESTH